MQEVYTISGAGYDPTTGEPAGTRSVTVQISPAVALQNALKALGTTSGDAQLSRLQVDGVIGPASVKAVNYALATYVGSTPSFPRADLTLVRVRQNAAALAVLITQRVQKSGGAVPAPVVQKAAARRVNPAALLPSGMSPSPGFGSSPRWIWWVVGGVSILLVLSVAAGAMKKRREATA